MARFQGANRLSHCDSGFVGLACDREVVFCGAVSTGSQVMKSSGGDLCLDPQLNPRNLLICVTSACLGSPRGVVIR